MNVAKAEQSLIFSRQLHGTKTDDRPMFHNTSAVSITGKAGADRPSGQPEEFREETVQRELPQSKSSKTMGRFLRWCSPKATIEYNSGHAGDRGVRSQSKWLAARRPTVI